MLTHTDPSEIIPCQLPPNKQFVNLTGLIFGRLVVEKLSGRKTTNGVHYYFWLCKCQCGTSTVVRGGNLRQRLTSSCGCLLKEYMSRNADIAHVPEKTVWSGMKDRCQNPNHKDFHRYGGRGIRVCDAWLMSFAAFFRDMGPRPNRSYTIERCDNDGNYTPGNCKWATIVEQNRNRNGVLRITFNGKTMCATAWDEFLGFRRTTVQHRLKLGWSIERALTQQPIRRR